MFEMAKRDKVNDGMLVADHPLTRPDRLSFAHRLKQIGLDCSITCNQLHASFPVAVLV